MLLRLLWIPMLPFIVCSIIGLDWIRTLAISTIVGLLPLLVCGRVMIDMIKDVFQRGDQERIAEIGKI